MIFSSSGISTAASPATGAKAVEQAATAVCCEDEGGAPGAAGDDGPAEASGWL